MKHLVRSFSLWLQDKTRRWVVPSSVWTKLDNGDVSARVDLSDIAVKWGTLDPEFVRASLLMRRVDYHKKVEARSTEVGETCLTCGRTICELQPEDHDPANCTFWKPKVPNQARLKPSLGSDGSGCCCYRCTQESGRTVNGLPEEMTRMIVCPRCGNKRCPHASDHRNACTNSNEPGQPGSIYSPNASLERQEP